MKINYTTQNGRLNFEFDPLTESQKELWAQLAAFQEVFEESECGKCGSTELRCVVRKSSDGKKKEFDYHELRCTKCGAKLAFGILNDGSGRLFPKRKGEDGKVLGKRGWVKWNPETEREE